MTPIARWIINWSAPMALGNLPPIPVEDPLPLETILSFRRAPPPPPTGDVLPFAPGALANIGEQVAPAPRIRDDEQTSADEQRKRRNIPQSRFAQPMDIRRDRYSVRLAPEIVTEQTNVYRDILKLVEPVADKVGKTPQAVLVQMAATTAEGILPLWNMFQQFFHCDASACLNFYPCKLCILTSRHMQTGHHAASGMPNSPASSARTHTRCTRGSTCTTRTRCAKSCATSTSRFRTAGSLRARLIGRDSFGRSWIMWRIQWVFPSLELHRWLISNNKASILSGVHDIEVLVCASGADPARDDFGGLMAIRGSDRALSFIRSTGFTLEAWSALYGIHCW